jgi:serralysin
VGAEKTAQGYIVALKDSVTNQFDIWSTDSNGNYKSNLLDDVSGNSKALEQFEFKFKQDLNGDGVIGVHRDDSFQFYDESIGNGSHSIPMDQPVQNGGAYQEVVDTSTLPSVDIGIPGVSLKVLYTDPVTGGEEVITHLDPGAVIPEHFHTYANESVYVLDGDFVENGVSYGPGTLLEGDAGTLHGPHTTVNGADVLTVFWGKLDFNVVDTTVTIEANGSTSLVRSGLNYYLDDAQGNGPTLKYNGAAVTPGEFGSYLPVGAEKTAQGYIVALKDSVTNQFDIWSTDSNGNYKSNLLDDVSGNSKVLEQFEFRFKQDLNGDGVIGVQRPSQHDHGPEDSGKPADVSVMQLDHQDSWHQHDHGHHDNGWASGHLLFA